MRDDTMMLRIAAIRNEKLAGYAALRFASKKREGQISDVYVIHETKSNLIKRL